MSDKREYIKPELEIIETDGYEMICASLTISEEETNDPGRVNERRGDWGNLWE